LQNISDATLNFHAIKHLTTNNGQGISVLQAQVQGQKKSTSTNGK
jgi:hypothetical protein